MNLSRPLFAFADVREMPMYLLTAAVERNGAKLIATSVDKSGRL